MSVAAVLAPLFAQVLLVVILSFVLGKRRVDAVRNGTVDMKAALVGDSRVWPKPAMLASNAFNNQFQFPVLFYILTILVLITNQTGPAFVAMAWLFVATRYIHAYIHVTTNRMPGRFYAFIAGVLILAVMWTVFAVRIFMAA